MRVCVDRGCVSARSPPPVVQSEKKRRTLEDNNEFLGGQIKSLKTKLENADMDGATKKQIEQLIEETKAVQEQADATAREYSKEKAELDNQVGRDGDGTGRDGLASTAALWPVAQG